MSLPYTPEVYWNPPGLQPRSEDSRLRWRPCWASDSIHCLLLLHPYREKQNASPDSLFKYQKGWKGRSHGPFPLAMLGNPPPSRRPSSILCSESPRVVQALNLLQRSSWLDCWGRGGGEGKGRESLFGFTHIILGGNFQEIMWQWR